MRIAWATPFSEHSAIARFSKAVVAELRARDHHVTIVRLEMDEALLASRLADDEHIATGTPADCDLVVLNIGNHAPYHVRALPMLAQHPALIILHDSELRDYIWGLRSLYGFTLPSLPFAAPLEMPEDPHEAIVNAQSAEVLGFLASMAAGCVAHGPHYLTPLAEHCPGPTKMLPLCYPKGSEIGQSPTARSSDAFVITAFGMLNPNKQLDRVLRAVALLRDEIAQVRVIFSGVIEPHYKDTLVRLSEHLEIPQPVFTGRLSDSDLSSVLSGSDVICCLRWPITEGASASAITAMHHARPLIVSDAGAFSLMPDDLVQKASYGNDPQDLAAAIARVARDRSDYEARARAAEAWASEQFSARNYVDLLTPVLEECLDVIPALLASQVCIDLFREPFGPNIVSAIGSTAAALDELLF